VKLATGAVLGLVLLASACDEPGAATRGGPRSPSRAAGAGAGADVPSREPVFAARTSKPDYDRGLAGMRAMNALRGTVMTEAIATDLGFKCADLKAVAAKLVAERDPLVFKLRTEIDRTCSFDVPIACARLEVQVIERKRAGDPSAALDRECSTLKLAIGDTGSGYLQNPAVLEVGDKFLTYCGSADGVRRIP
jgi:hypothetical protein